MAHAAAVLAAIARADERTRAGGLVLIKDVREESSLSRSVFDRTLLELFKTRRVDLKRANDPRTKWDGVPDSEGGEFFAVLHKGSLGDASLDERFPRAEAVVDGLTVRDSIPNRASIAATFSRYKVLLGVRAVPMDAFEVKGERTTRATASARVRKLADEIAASGEINPLIIVADAEPYILEGAHRIDALDVLGKKAFPALVVIDLDDAPAGALGGHVAKYKRDDILIIHDEKWCRSYYAGGSLEMAERDGWPVSVKVVNVDSVNKLVTVSYPNGGTKSMHFDTLAAEGAPGRADEPAADADEDAPLTLKDIEDWFREHGRKAKRHLDKADAEKLLEACESASNHKRVDKALELADKLIDGHGVEAVQPEGAHVDNYYRDSVLLYVNMGDTYAATLCYDTELERFFIGSWGDFLESWEQEQAALAEEDEDEEDDDEVDDDDEPPEVLNAHKMTLAQARSILSPLGISLKKVDDEYIVNFKGGKEETAYFASDLDDAVGTGKDMAARRKAHG